MGRRLRAARKDLGLARRIANLEKVRADELREALNEVVMAWDTTDAEREVAAIAAAREVLQADLRRTHGVD